MGIFPCYLDDRFATGYGDLLPDYVGEEYQFDAQDRGGVDAVQPAWRVGGCAEEGAEELEVVVCCCPRAAGVQKAKQQYSLPPLAPSWWDNVQASPPRALIMTSLASVYPHR
jgi:hypothetical protein